MPIKEKIKPILSAAFSAAVAIMLLGYSAYGWMTMARQMRAEGINVEISVPDDLQISTNRDTGYASTISVNLDEVVKSTVDNSFELDEDHFYLLPASSYEGLSIWQTETSRMDGSAICDENAFDPGWMLSRRGATHTFEGHYVDVNLYLRSGSTKKYNMVLNSDRSSILGDADVRGVVRAAFLNSDATAVSYPDNAGYYANTLVYADPSHNSPQIVTDNGGVSKYEHSLYLSFNADKQSDQVICTVGETDYSSGHPVYTPTCITVRIWIEGQDSACRGSLMNDKKVFRVNLGFDIQK